MMRSCIVTPTKKKKVEFEEAKHNLVPLVHPLHFGVGSNDVENGPTKLGIELLNPEHHHKPGRSNDTWDDNEERLHCAPQCTRPIAIDGVEVRHAVDLVKKSRFRLVDLDGSEHDESHMEE